MLEAICDGIVAVCAVGMLWTARRGLKTWKEQTQTTSERECALKFLASIIHAQDAIGTARHPGMRVDRDSPEVEDEIWRGRLARLLEAESEMRQARIEASTFWGGQEVMEIFITMNSLCVELAESIMEYRAIHANGSSDRSQGEQYNEGDTKHFQRLQDISFGHGGSGDEFNKKVVEAVSRAEDFLRPIIDIKK